MVGPFPPAVGGMVSLTVSLCSRFKSDGHKVRQIDVKSGIIGIIRLPWLYAEMLCLFLVSDIVHIVSGSGGSLYAKDLPAVLLGRILGKKTFLNFIGGGAVEKSREWFWWKKLPFILADAVVVPTASFRDSLVFNGIKGRFRVIPNPVEVDYYRIKELRKKSGLILIAAKGMYSYAGHVKLLDIFQKVKGRIPEARFWIASDGPERTNIEQRVKTLALEDVEFFGNISRQELRGLFHRATLFVHGTKYESFGLSLVEAMSAGMPVIAFNAGGIKDVVIDGENGYLIQYDDLQGFADRVVELLDNEELYQKFQENCIARSDVFSIENTVSKWYKRYTLVKS